MTVMKFLRASMALFGLLAFGSMAQAADLATRAPPPEPVTIDSFQPFQVRLRVTAVIADGSTRFFDRFGKIPVAAGLTSGPGSQIYGAGADISRSVIPELDLSYYLTKNIALETICCFTRNHITTKGSLGTLDVGSVWVFPPSLIIQYHFTELGAFQPYFGVGVNYSAYFGAQPGKSWEPLYTPLLGPVGANMVNRLHVASSWGAVGQIGFDYMWTENWGFNIDVKRVLMEPTAYGHVYNSALNTTIPVRAQVNIDPWMVSGGITYRFGGAGSAPVFAKY